MLTTCSSLRIYAGVGLHPYLLHGYPIVLQARIRKQFRINIPLAAIYGPIRSGNM